MPSTLARIRRRNKERAKRIAMRRVWQRMDVASVQEETAYDDIDWLLREVKRLNQIIAERS